VKFFRTEWLRGREVRKEEEKVKKRKRNVRKSEVELLLEN
jgi:hypothetical protein